MNSVTTDSLAMLADYPQWRHAIKQRVVSARLRLYRSQAAPAAALLGQQAVDPIAWGHSILIFTKSSSTPSTAFAAPAFIWQRAVAKLAGNLKGALPTVEEIEQDLQQLHGGMDE